MPLYRYIAKERDGKTIQGSIETTSLQSAADALRERKLLIIEIEEEKKKLVLKASMSVLNRIRSKDIVLFSRQLAVMMSANVPLVRGLRVLMRQTDSINLKIVLSQIADDVEGGTRLSRALARHPKVFSPYFYHMVTSGETTGKIDEVLNTLADQMEKDYDLRSRLKGSMIYPAFIFSALIVIGTLMMIFVIPRFVEVLRQSGQALPLPTRMLIWLSWLFSTKWWLLLGIAIGCVVAVTVYRRTKEGERVFDEIKIRLPIFGSIYQKIYLTRLLQSLAGLIKSGVPITQSLKIGGDIVGNAVYRDVTYATIKEVEVGNSIATVYGRNPMVPPMVAHMMRVGEETGRIDFILEKLGAFYNREVENSVKNLITLLEPTIFLFLGIAAAIFVLGILLPVYQLSTGGFAG